MRSNTLPTRQKIRQQHIFVVYDIATDAGNTSNLEHYYTEYNYD